MRPHRGRETSVDRRNMRPQREQETSSDRWNMRPQREQDTYANRWNMRPHYNSTSANQDFGLNRDDKYVFLFIM